MKKDIYIIKNKINNLVYIGQAKDSKMRWAGHCSNARKQTHLQIIDEAMRNLGIENFWYEVIETTENYDERERFWIAYYNSVTPNGYNYLSGGDGANIGTQSANAIIRDDNILNNIIHEIQTTNLTLLEIANKYDITEKNISAINRGTYYHRDDLTYPLRTRLVDSITDTQIQNVKNALINSRKSFHIIAQENNLTDYMVKQINLGEKFADAVVNYPLRSDFRAEEVAKVKELLKTTTLSMREIGRQCNTSYTMVNHINIGKYHYSEQEQYPIRNTNK